MTRISFLRYCLIYAQRPHCMPVEHMEMDMRRRLDGHEPMAVYSYSMDGEEWMDGMCPMDDMHDDEMCTVPTI